jgi:hypothetical protein
MTEIGIGLVALALGVALGIAAAATRRRPTADAVVQARLDAQSAEIRRLADAASAQGGSADELRRELSAARGVLETMKVREEERRSLDERDRETVRRLATVLAGGASKGRAGEHVLREHLSQLPPSMLASDFRVGGRTVEFALVLPDGRRLPIDSKWAALAELEQLERTDDPVDRERLARALEREVSRRAQEVASYLDPAVTAPVALAAVPDAVYAALRRAHADAFARGVVIVPYATALPIALFLYALVQRFGEATDVQAALAEVASLLDQMEAVVENKFQKASTMIANGAGEFRSHLGKARGSIARAAGADQGASPPDEGVIALVN